MLGLLATNEHAVHMPSGPCGEVFHQVYYLATSDSYQGHDLLLQSPTVVTNTSLR